MSTIPTLEQMRQWNRDNVMAQMTPPTPEQLAQYKREDDARKKWFGHHYVENDRHLTHASLLLESMSTQITTLSDKVDRLAAKLAKQDD